jgi:hypothetical protein
MPFTTLSKLVVTIFVLAMLLPGTAQAQSTTQGAISGTVSDPSSAVLPNLTVTLKNLNKGYTHATTTNAQGAYQFALIEPGHYEIQVAASGFKQYTAKVSVNVGQVTLVNAKLEVGSIGTMVEVSGVAPLMETESADMSTAFDQNLVENLPNGGNDLTAVAYTAPGVVMNSGGMYGNFTANGLPATSNVFTVDGRIDKQNSPLRLDCDSGMLRTRQLLQLGQRFDQFCRPFPLGAARRAVQGFPDPFVRKRL